MTLGFLKALGVRVHHVDGLQEGALFVEDRQILFVDRQLPPRAALLMARQALAHVDLDLEPPRI